jgi:tripeptide aminopeptidase
MDTVVPGKGVKVQFKDGIFTSDGTTILGSDDKSAIAIILEVMAVVQENHLPCPPVELIFTVCEEIGLLGAKSLDMTLIESKFGYILDSTDT